MHEPTAYRPGVGIVLIDQRGLVFAGYRRDGRQPPWQMPQGGMNVGESPERAVRRELAEELGTEKAAIVGMFPGWLRYDYPNSSISRRARAFRGQQHLWFLMRFGGRDDDIRLGTEHAEFLKWKWTSPDELIDSVASFKRQVYRQVITYFAPSLKSSTLAVPGQPARYPAPLPSTDHTSA